MKFDYDTFLKLCKILILVLVLYFLLRALRYFLGGSGSNNSKLDERNVFDGSVPSITDNTASNLADELYRAMGKYGTDEDAITAVLMKINGASDLVKVHNAFGVRPYLKILGVSAVDFIDKHFADHLTLKEWLKEELSEKEFAPWRFLYEQIG